MSVKPGKYFHFLNTIESRGFDDEMFCWRIRPGMVIDGDNTFIYSYNDETGDIDHDTNATCYLSEKYIYKTMEECITAMRDEFEEFVARKIQSLSEMRTEMEFDIKVSREVYGETP